MPAERPSQEQHASSFHLAAIYIKTSTNTRQQPRLSGIFLKTLPQLRKELVGPFLRVTLQKTRAW
ncbi:hypothetical protein E2C01_053337 [Portunus trituberculatus]|uniref:Uncharacterized protein n=1 Tax=Portunus trituberculatus TaxID=210409 RepID=A0A5B7GNX9_PORTR|nr:hypothetical protein [Portunus trituberculatus]